MSSNYVDPLLALAAKICGVQSHRIDPLEVMITCIDIGAPHVALMILEYMCSMSSGGSFLGLPPLSPIPYGIGRGLESICIIPPEKITKEKIVPAPYTSRITYFVEAIRQERKQGEQEEGKRPIGYEIEVPEAFAVIIYYRGTDGGLNAVALVCERTRTPAGYSGYIAPPDIAKKLISVCEKRGPIPSYEERVFKPEEAEQLAQEGFARPVYTREQETNEEGQGNEEELELEI